MRHNRIIVLIMIAAATCLTASAQDFGAYRQDYTSPPPPGAGFMQTDRSYHSSWGGSFPNSFFNSGYPDWYGNGWNQNYNNGILHLIGVGYDAQGVWQTVPLIVEYQWNGVTYDLTVIDAWNPWTRAWDGSLDISAYQTEYQLRGVTYNWYVNLSTGTYYFNV